MFNRIAIQGLPVFLRGVPFEPPEFTKNRVWLVETGIVFEPDKEKAKTSGDDSRKAVDLIREDANNILGPSFGLSIDDMMAARKDEAKAAQVKEAMAQPNPDFMAGMFDLQKFMDNIKRLSVNVTRAATIKLRNDEKLDAYATIPSAYSSLDMDDERSVKHDAVVV